MSDRTNRASRWPVSWANHERATRSLPGGNTRTQLHSEPFPVYGERGNGARITLSDGAEVDDFVGNFTAAALGHNHPRVVEAVERCLRSGGALGVPVTSEVELAEAICDRFPAAERVRFTNSGSEATLHAIRAARAHKGRPKIAKAAGAYHGAYDLVDLAVTKLDSPAGGYGPETSGAPATIRDQVVVFPFNDRAGALQALEPHRGELAAVLIEVFLNSGGAIPGELKFLQGLAGWCASNDVLLVVDEVASWRTSFRGAATDYGIVPDVLCLGKALGGGFPVGAIAGRSEVMAVFDPRRTDPVRHPGTFNGHPLVMEAGRATLAALDRATIDRMNLLGKRLERGVTDVGTRLGLPLCATGYGSIGRIHVSRAKPTDARQVLELPHEPLEELRWTLLEHEVLLGPRGRYSVGAQTSEGQVERLLAAIEEVAPRVVSGAEPACPIPFTADERSSIT